LPVTANFQRVWTKGDSKDIPVADKSLLVDDFSGLVSLTGRAINLLFIQIVADFMNNPRRRAV